MMTHQINIFLLLFGALQGWLLSFWFLRNQHKKIANLYFALFLVVIGLQLTFKVITKMWLMENVLVAYILSYKLPYLVGPLLYLFIRSRCDHPYKKIDLLHFLPFAFFVVYTLIIMKVHWYDWHLYSQALFQLISLMTYGYLSLQFGNGQLRRFIKLVMLAESIIILTLAIMVIYYGRFPDVRLLFLSLTFLIYWISYAAISKPDLFLEKETSSIIPMELRKNPKYAHSSLKSEEAKRIETALKEMMFNEKCFLDSSLTIDSLSTKLNTSRHHLSQVLNEKLNKSYVDFISELRLEEARTRLRDPSNFRFTIAAIALDSGFSSVSSFNESFKKRFGVTPSKFRDQHLNKMSA